MSLQGRTLRMVQAGQPVSVGERVSEGDAFTVYRASAGNAPLAVSWYPDLPGTRSLAKLLTWLVDIGSPHPAFTWPIDTVMSEEMPGFGLIMPLPEPGLESLGHLLSRAESPSFTVLISIGRQLVSAFEDLHEAAMCYRDERAFTVGLSDPSSGRVTEEQWLSALARLEDCVWACSCGASVLRDPDDPGQRCWDCGLTVQ